MSTSTPVEVWVDSLADGWRRSDPDAIAALFTPDASYQRHPFKDPLIGRASIVSAWADQLDGSTFKEIHMGSPVVDADRAAVEWWSVSEATGGETTHTGTIFLTFSAGLCTHLREVWMSDGSSRSPYPGWGT